MNGRTIEHMRARITFCYKCYEIPPIIPPLRPPQASQRPPTVMASNDRPARPNSLNVTYVIDEPTAVMLPSVREPSGRIRRPPNRFSPSTPCHVVAVLAGHRQCQPSPLTWTALNALATPVDTAPDGYYHFKF